MGRVSGIKTAADIVMLFLLFRLVGCNSVLMKRFLPLFILTGLLFGQTEDDIKAIFSLDSLDVLEKSLANEKVLNKKTNWFVM